MTSNKKLGTPEIDSMLEILENRFKQTPERFMNLDWSDITSKLKQNPDKLWSLNEMEKTGGEPNLLEYNKDLDQYIFCDFSKESPSGRRSLCYDRNALEARKKFKPADNAKDVAHSMGVDLMNEMEYKKLQSIDEFDTKTSSWLDTPDRIRKLGGAIFGDRRYGQVFIYHNGADSYYAARGFRGIVKL
ncbi:DUF4256 domain-containing protein [Pontibacter sp. MBLB2868]|uniref:DUF4256 domain-containing protein n=1 Tax=Pontibacter sp. MBLB2868 TaxID=3451555 RepID=UPI003F74B7E2